MERPARGPFACGLLGLVGQVAEKLEALILEFGNAHAWPAHSEGEELPLDVERLPLIPAHAFLERIIVVQHGHDDPGLLNPFVKVQAPGWHGPSFLKFSARTLRNVKTSAATPSIYSSPTEGTSRARPRGRGPRRSIPPAPESPRFGRATPGTCTSKARTHASPWRT